MDKEIILIGGMPTAGKSTIARALAKRLDLPWISTDQICVVMQSATTPKGNPELFYPEFDSYEDFMESHSAEFIYDLEYQQDHEIWKGVSAFINKQSTWSDGYIIEGVAILPSVVASTYPNSQNIKTVFVTDSDHERARQVVFNRGVGGDAKSYEDHVKSKELEWILLLDQRIRSEANELGFPIVEISKDDSDIEKILEALN